MQAPPIYLLSRYCDGTATGQNALGDAVIFEFIHDGGRIFRRQVGEERAKLWLTRPQEEVAKPASATRMLPINTPFCTADSLA